jgi:hypothetical protein
MKLTTQLHPVKSLRKIAATPIHTPSHHAMHTDNFTLIFMEKVFQCSLKYPRDPQGCIKAFQEVIHLGFNLLQKDVIQNRCIN